MIGHRSRQIFVVAATVAALLSGALVSACGGGDENATSTPTSAPQSGSANAGQTGKGSGNASAGQTGKNATADSFDPSSFGNPATGANEFLPLEPGTQTTREGFVNVGSRRLPHRVVTTVTDVSKEIAGVRTVVILDQDFNGGQIAEQALDFVAEDKQGNVWSLGSYTESYEGGQFVNASDAWLAGVNGATPGVLMLADPQPGTPEYTESAIPGGEVSTSQVAETGQSQCVPFKCYKDVLVIEEGGGEYKYYAPGVGQIKTEPLSGDGKQEVEDLINLTQLSPRGLAEVSAEVLKLDRNAPGQAPDVFGDAAAAKRNL
ncbi:MAG: hypothetical protein AABM42_07535 [Actinomycetota bacterium]